MIIFRLPMIFYVLFTGNGDDKIVFSLTYSLFQTIGHSYNFFFFLIMLIFNKIFSQLFLEYCPCFKRVFTVKKNHTLNNNKVINNLILKNVFTDLELTRYKKY